MKNWIKYTFFLALIAMLPSCMEEVGDFTVNGEAITGFELTSPENNDTIKINTGALTETQVFSWGETESGLGSPIVYTILFDRADGDFSTPIWSKTSDSAGAETKATLTFDELKQVYTTAGASGVVSVKWNVKAENGSPNVKMGQVASFVKIALSADGVSNFQLVSPPDQSVLSFDGTMENEVFAFDWNDATATSGSLTYKFYLDLLDGDFSAPLLTLDADDEGAASQVSKTHGEWKTLLEQNNIEEGPYKWTVKAISSDLEWMKDVFEVYFEFVNWKKPIYIVGAATSVGWDINNALEMNFVAPNVWTGVYELKAGQDFKFFPERGSWDNGIGADRFEKFIGCSDPGNGNITNTGTTDGFYFVIVDLNTKTVTVSDGPKILGGSVIADWNTANAIPLQMVENGVYDTYQYITVDGYGFKFVPSNAGWDGDFGASKISEGFLDQADENNLTVEADGFYRVRVNMNDFSYSVVETNWGIIGSASPGGWSDDTNMSFTAAKGEYTWSADITLADGEIKFRANDGWDINLGDNGADGSLEYNGGNIAVSAGNYHIELILNSVTGFTYTITAN
jgi:hypothetical protein